MTLQVGLVWLAASAGTVADDTMLRERFASGVIRWGGDAEGGAPYQLRSPDDPAKVVGFEVELADALALQIGRRLGIPLRAEFVQYDWVSLPLGLDKRDFDLVLAGYEITPQNLQHMLFSRPYYIFAQQLVVRKDETQIDMLEDCLDRPIGTLSECAAYHLLRRQGARNIVRYDGQTEPYFDLELGRLDAVLLDVPIAVYYAGFNPKLRFQGEPFAPGEYGVGMRQDDQRLAELVNDSLGELIRDGTLRRIYRRWHLHNEQQKALVRGTQRDEELAGLGFAADGTFLDADAPPPDDAIEVQILQASATQWTFDRYAPLLVRAAGTTVVLTMLSMSVAVVLGISIASARLFGPAPVRWLALVYVEFFRGTPLLLLLIFLYYGLPNVHWGIEGFRIQLTAFQTAILGFGLNYAAYEAEIYRSAILSVPHGQWEAARALAMSDLLTFRRIVFPQAFRTALGPVTNDFVAMFKDTSLVSVIAVHELTKEYEVLARSSFKFVELGLLTAALYLAMSVPLGYLSRWLEKRWGGGRLIV